MPTLRVRSAELAEHVLPAGRVLGEILDHIPVLYDLPVPELEEVHAGGLGRCLVVRVDRDEVALSDHPVAVRVNGTDLADQRFRGFEAIGRLRVVVDEVTGQQASEGGDIAGAERLVEPADGRLVVLLRVMTASLSLFPYSTYGIGMRNHVSIRCVWKSGRASGSRQNSDILCGWLTTSPAGAAPAAGAAPD